MISFRTWSQKIKRLFVRLSDFWLTTTELHFSSIGKLLLIVVVFLVAVDAAYVSAAFDVDSCTVFYVCAAVATAAAVLTASTIGITLAVADSQLMFLYQFHFIKLFSREETSKARF